MVEQQFDRQGPALACRCWPAAASTSYVPIDFRPAACRQWHLMAGSRFTGEIDDGGRLVLALAVAGIESLLSRARRQSACDRPVHADDRAKPACRCRFNGDATGTTAQ